MTEEPFKHDEPQSTDSREETSSADSALAYHIVAVYVAPEIRGKGLGKDLMSSALATIAQNLQEKRFDKAICTLTVERGLGAARKMYESMGFVAVAKDDYTSDDGRVFHEFVMRRDLTF